MDKSAKDKFLKELMEAAYEKVYIFIDRRQTDKGLVEDVVQETFLEAYKKAEVLAEHPNPLGWLYLTARNKMLSLSGSRKDLCFFEDGEEAYLNRAKMDDAKYGEVELEESIKAVVSEKDYQMLCDYYLNGYNSGELAGKYGVERGSLRMQVSRLKKKLRKIL